MNLSHQKITLDVNNNSTVTLNAHQGDSGTRFIDVTLTENGKVIPLSETLTATAKASLYGMVKGVNKCVLDTEENKIVVELTETMLSTPGMLKMEITLTEGEQIITSQTFTVDVEESVVNGSTAITENTDLAKLQRAIFLVGELSELENLAELDNMATTAYNRFAQYSGEAVDLNKRSITDTLVVNLSGCTVDNAPVTGAISGTVVNLNYKVDLESIIVQFLITGNNYTYKRSYSTTNGWSSWVLVADDLSKYLKTADLQGAILSDTPSDTTTYHSNRINTLLKEKIDTVALRGADIKTVPAYLTLAQKEGNTLALYFSELFNDDTPSDRTTFSGAKLDEMLSDKEDNSKKVTTGSPSYKEAQYPSIAHLEKYYRTKDETDIMLDSKAEKSAVDSNTYDLSMLMSSLVKTSTGKGVVNLTSTAQNGILKITSDSGVTVKNQNMYEGALPEVVKKSKCNVSYDNITGEYTVEFTGSSSDTFYFGALRNKGDKFGDVCGTKQKYHKNLSYRVNCDKLTRGGIWITYFDSNNVSITHVHKSTNTTYKIDDVEGAEYFTLQIGFDFNNGAFTTGDIFTFSVQVEYGDTVSDDFVVPLSNTDNLSYDGVTNVIGDGDITVQYVPDLRKICEKL